MHRNADRKFAGVTWLTVVVTFIGLVGISTIVDASEKNVVPPKVGTAQSHMVVAAHPQAVAIGHAVLNAGGSAADAAVAVQIALNLFEPQSSGIGGGAFLLYWDASESVLSTLDGRERAPLSADETYWLDGNGAPVPWWDAVVGGRSVGVPGTLKLLEAVHTRHGRLPWIDLFAPTIEAAETGFPISPRLAASIAAAQERGLDAFPATRAYFFHADGTPKAANDRLRNPEFARALTQIAAEGTDPFYEGAIAGDIVAAVRTPFNGGILTRKDLSSYTVVERPPLCQSYRAYRICGMGPPTSGGLTVSMILSMLEPFDLTKLGPTPDAWHLYAEAAKLAYADRALYMADSDFQDVPVRGLLDPTYLTERSGLIDPEKAMAKAKAGTPPWRAARRLAPDLQRERAGTSHFVIVDRYGDMVSMTTTIETGFGSRVMTNGFLLNNELTDFSRAPERDGQKIANRVQGGKRPRSSMSPTIVFANDEPRLLIGSPGGSRIINYVAQSIIAVLDWQLPLEKALALGHVVNRNGDTELEADTDALALQTALEARGHTISVRDLNSGLHAIHIDANGMLTGAADPRREGTVLGK